MRSLGTTLQKKGWLRLVSYHHSSFCLVPRCLFSRNNSKTRRHRKRLLHLRHGWRRRRRIVRGRWGRRRSYLERGSGERRAGAPREVDISVLIRVVSLTEACCCFCSFLQGTQQGGQYVRAMGCICEDGVIDLVGRFSKQIFVCWTFPFP